MDDDNDKVIERTLAPMGKKINLEDYPTSWKECDDLTLDGLRLSKQDSDKILERSRDELERVQELLWAEDSYSSLSFFREWMGRARIALSTTSCPG